MDSEIELNTNSFCKHSSIPEELLEFINTGSKFIIAGHKEPDGDCIGSQLALRSALLRLGKTVLVYSAGPLDRSELKYYKNLFDTPTEKKLEGVRAIIVDSSGIDRTGDLQTYLENLPCAIIDHHSAVTYPPSTPRSPVYVDPNSPSCTLLIEKLITALGLEITKEEAELLFFGLCTDTGFFRHLTEHDAQVFEFTARMLNHGSSPKKAFYAMTGGKTLDSRILIGHILSRIESYFDGRLLISYETLEDYNAYGYKERDSDSLNQILMSIENVEAIAIIRQECDGNCAVSLRSVDKIDVAKLASSFGGGGHRNASGLTLRGDISKVKQIILDSFSTFFS